MSDGAVSRVRAHGLRLTGPRRQVIDVLEAADAPMSVDEIAAHLPDVHLSSVYRSLGVLEEVGAIRHLHLPHGAARYERWSEDDRAYVVCGVCGRHAVVGPEILEGLRTRLRREVGFELDTAHAAFSGRCVGCVEAPDRPHRHT